MKLEGNVTTEPQSGQVKSLFCTYFHDMCESIAAVVHQLDLPNIVSRLSTRETSTYLSTSMQMMALSSQRPSYPNSRQSNKDVSNFIEVCLNIPFKLEQRPILATCGMKNVKCPCLIDSPNNRKNL